MATSARIRWLGGLVVVVLAGLVVGGGACAPSVQEPTVITEAREVDEARAELYPVTIHQPKLKALLDIGVVGPDGKPELVACSTCHAAKPANPDARSGVSLRMFHQSLNVQHADLSCVTCHNPDDHYGTLRLANGRGIPFSEVMTLCAQCHGTQYRDYQNGSHGGMTGYWDLKRGPRQRLNCIDCHDPHAPQYPTVTPAPPPNDRFKPVIKEYGHE